MLWTKVKLLVLLVDFKKAFDLVDHQILLNKLDIYGIKDEALIGLELAIDPPPPPRGNFVHYDFLKLHYIRHKIKDVSPLRVAALTCNSTLYTLPPIIALKVPDNVSTMTCSYIFAC